MGRGYQAEHKRASEIPTEFLRLEAGGPMRVAEQRSKRGGCPRGLFEGEHKQNRLSQRTHEPEFRSGPRL